jgi:hypothetical protein
MIEVCLHLTFSDDSLDNQNYCLDNMLLKLSLLDAILFADYFKNGLR